MKSVSLNLLETSRKTEWDSACRAKTQHLSKQSVSLGLSVLLSVCQWVSCYVLDLLFTQNITYFAFTSPMKLGQYPVKTSDKPSTCIFRPRNTPILPFPYMDSSYGGNSSSLQHMQLPTSTKCRATLSAFKSHGTPIKSLSKLGLRYSGNNW